jgi:4-hydroxythreonine-4-phosphate dehydrogenase
MSDIPRIVLTPGEPAGVGPDLVVTLAQSEHAAELIAASDPSLLEARARRLGLSLRLRERRPGEPPRAQPAGTLGIAPVALSVDATPGRLDPRNAEHVLETLRLAARLCRQGDCDAMVTGPVQKSVINEAGMPFTGHTEFLAQLTGAPRPIMMLAAPGLRVALLTTHLPLREVAERIHGDDLERVIRLLSDELAARFGLVRPRLLVAGLNPHAGEGGYLGREEIEIITPVLEKLKREGLTLQGPLPADTLFTPRHLEHADAVLAMYHDQGLPVLKHLGFGRTVNVTLGLPIVRTSVDHGTALDLAGSGRADPSSLGEALATAIAMARRGR